MNSLAYLQFLTVIWTLLLASCHSFPTNEVSGLVAFKESVNEDPLLVLSDWNAKDADPCSWSGIRCSLTGDHVIALNLSSFSLRGFIAPELGFLTSLQELVLHNNSLLGTIPKEIGTLKSLKVLDLGMNKLSGPIPRELGNLTNVMKLNLQSNGLTGRIPPELGYLANLVELQLERNKLQGTVPGSNNLINFTTDMQRKYAPRKNATGLCQLTHLRVADFSNNSFVGIIPSCLNYLPRSSFQGNCFQDRDSNLQRSSKQCGGIGPVKSHPEPNPEARHAEDVRSERDGSSRPAWLLALEIITGTIMVLLIFVAILTAAKRCNTKRSVISTWKKTSTGKDHITISIDAEILKDVLSISHQELEVACEDFSNIIGSSPDSVVYKGTMKDGPEIAAISLCVSEEQWTNYLEFYFESEVADLARLNHENTGKLLGYCKESNPFSRMLVFEYASNGTLYEHLHYGEGSQLSWIRRMRIIIGIARGLKYLHTELQPPFTVSELNSSSIYLTEFFSPKLVDFERWKTVLAKSEKSYSGYMSNGIATQGFPDLPERRHLDVQGNTFSFGVILLEIVSGRPPYCKDRGCLVDWAREYLELPEVISYLVDPELRYFRHSDLQVICEVVNLCVQSDPRERPSMHTLSTILENGIDISTAADLKESPLAWAELALSS